MARELSLYKKVLFDIILISRGPIFRLRSWRTMLKPEAESHVYIQKSITVVEAPSSKPGLALHRYLELPKRDLRSWDNLARRILLQAVQSWNWDWNYNFLSNDNKLNQNIYYTWSYLKLKLSFDGAFHFETLDGNFDFWVILYDNDNWLWWTCIILVIIL